MWSPRAPRPIRMLSSFINWAANTPRALPSASRWTPTPRCGCSRKNDSRRRVSLVVPRERGDFALDFQTAKHRHCERSEAIHLSTRGAMDCFVAFAPRNDVALTSVHVLAARGARALQDNVPRDQRAQGIPGARSTPTLPCAYENHTP